MKIPVFVILTTLTFAAAQSAPTAAITRLDISPEGQEVRLSLATDLGFPLGEQTATATLNCTSGKAPDITAWKEVGFDEVARDEEATKGILGSKVVTSTPNAFTVNGEGGILRFYCEKGLLFTDLSRISGDSAKTVLVNTSASTTFRLDQSGLSRRVILSYPLISEMRGPRLIPNGFNLRFESANGTLSGANRKLISFGIVDVAREKKAGIFWYDPKINTLWPMRYGGNDGGLEKLIGRNIGDSMVLYYAPDYSVNSGWRKTTIDFKRSLIWSEPSAKPAGAKFGN